MSSFKKLSKADITTSPYAANKQWVLPFSCPSISNGYFNIYKGTFITGTFSPDNYTTDPITNGQYERLVYNSINHLFYQKFSGSLDTSSLMFNLTTYESASQQRPTNSYFDYNVNPNLVKNFPTGAGASIRVLAVNQDIYGSKILPYSFNLSSSAYYMTDDGNGNIYSGSTHIGNIFYAHGLAVITNPDYQLMFPLPPIAVNDVATFVTSNTSTKTINILQNDISRSCALDTGSVVLSGSNSSYYTVNSNGTITLNTSASGNYDVYYTVNSLCGNGCSLTSNKAKVNVNVVAVNPPPCITVEFYNSNPASTFHYVYCGSPITSSLTLGPSDSNVFACIDATFGVSGSSNWKYRGECTASAPPCINYTLTNTSGGNISYSYLNCSNVEQSGSLGDNFGTSFCAIENSVITPDVVGITLTNNDVCSDCASYTLQGSIIATETFLYVTCSTGLPVTESGVNSTGVIRCVDPSYGVYMVTGSGTINFIAPACISSATICVGDGTLDACACNQTDAVYFAGNFTAGTTLYTDSGLTSLYYNGVYPNINYSGSLYYVNYGESILIADGSC